MSEYIPDKIYSQQKNRLTRAIKSGDPQRVIDECTKAVASWNTYTAWPDDWTRWQRALDDLGPAGQWHTILLDDLA